jgi:hypothetical protein
MNTVAAGWAQPLDYEAMVRAFHAWLDSRPAGYNGEGVGNPGGRWFDAFADGARWGAGLRHQSGKKSGPIDKLADEGEAAYRSGDAKVFAAWIIDHAPLIVASIRTLAEVNARERHQVGREVPAEPVKVLQTEFGELGNCQSACLATLLGLPIDQVPNWTALTTFSDNEKYRAMQQWLRERGWHLFTVNAIPQHGYCIAGGKAARGLYHAVIYKDGAPWHDPMPGGGGLISADEADLLVPIAPHTCEFVAWRDVRGPDGWIDDVIRDLSELPDRNSPDDFPEALIVTGDEIREAIKRHAIGKKS